MTIYYTAKDIEELAARGIRELEIGPSVTLTDFARETAQQLDIDLIDGGKKMPTTATVTAPATSHKTLGSSEKYNKPSGCQHGSASLPATNSGANVAAGEPTDGGSSNTVNKLIDLMGKAVKRGG